MKKYMPVLVFILLFITLLGFNTNSVSASNCAPGDLFDSTTGQACVPKVSNECAPGDLFSTVTGLPCSVPIPIPPTPAPTTQLTYTQNPTQIGNPTLYDFSLSSVNTFDKVVINSDCKNKEVKISSISFGLLSCKPYTVRLMPTTGITHSLYLSSKDSNTHYVNIKASIYAKGKFVGTASTLVPVYPLTTKISSITVLSPNGGETWQKGTTQTIKWQDNTPIPACPVGATCMIPPSLYNIYLQSGGECNYPAVCASPMQTIATQVNGRSFNWRIDDQTGGYGNFYSPGSYKIKVCKSDTITCDSSDSSFTITSNINQPSITSLGTDNALPGEKVAVYIYNFPISTSYQYNVSFTGPTSSTSVIGSLSVDGSYVGFTVPNLSPGPYKISVFTSNGVNSYNSLPFTIGTPSTQPSITVLSPNGGEVWTKGTTQTIKWNDTNDISTHEIKLIPYCGSTTCDTSIYHTPYTIANTQGNMYKWSVGNTWESPIVPDGAYTIRVCQTGTSVCDSSDSYFKITSGSTTNHAPVIGLFPTPNNVSVGQSVNFNFSATDSDNDNLSWGVDWGDGPSATSSCPVNPPIVTGQGWNYNTSHTWNSAGNYTVRVYVNDCKGGSDSTSFTINVGSTPTQPSITVTSPNGGESYQVGGQMTVRWSTNNYTGSTVSLVLRKSDIASTFPADSGSQAVLVANTGTYTWTIANIITGQYYLRILCNPESACPSADSQLFTINPTTTQPAQGVTANYVNTTFNSTKNITSGVLISETYTTTITVSAIGNDFFINPVASYVPNTVLSTTQDGSANTAYGFNVAVLNSNNQYVTTTQVPSVDVAQSVSCISGCIQQSLTSMKIPSGATATFVISNTLSNMGGNTIASGAYKVAIFSTNASINSNGSSVVAYTNTPAYNFISPVSPDSFQSTNAASTQSSSISPSPAIQFSSTYPNLAGTWYFGSKAASIVQSGSTLTFTNENGSVSPGYFSSVNSVVAYYWGNLTGVISSDIQKISWANNTTWTRTSSSTATSDSSTPTIPMSPSNLTPASQVPTAPGSVPNPLPTAPDSSTPTIPMSPSNLTPASQVPTSPAQTRAYSCPTGYTLNGTTCTLSTNMNSSANYSASVIYAFPSVPVGCSSTKGYSITTGKLCAQ